jgi:hypothetical protein
VDFGIVGCDGRYSVMTTKETLHYWREYASSYVAARRYARLFDEVSAYTLFIGYPRSGYTLYGAVLNAHPDAVVCHELDALFYVARGMPREQLFALILKRERWFREERHSRWFSFDYTIPGQWQGRIRRLKVIGDKRGGASSVRLGQSPELIDRLRRTVQVPLRIVHIVRNPYDNISTMCLRNGYGIDDASRAYLSRATTNQRVIEWCDPSEILTVRHEDFIAQPKEILSIITKFVGLESTDSYLEACASIVFNKPSRSRTRIDWSDDHITMLAERIQQVPFLGGYAYDD